MNAGLIGRHYRVQGMTDIETHITILADMGTYYRILMVSHNSVGSSESEETLDKELFGSCLRTGYIVECQEAVLTSA